MPTTINPYMGGFQIFEARLSYPHLFTPEAVKRPGQPVDPTARKSYSCQLICDAGTDTKELVATITQIANEKFPSGIPSPFQWPLFDTIQKYPDRTDMAGTVTITCKRQEKDGRPMLRLVDGSVITDPGVLYPGCRVYVFVKPYAYNHLSKGVNFGLEGVMFQGDDDRLDSRITENAFMQGVTGALPAGGMGGNPPQPNAPGTLAAAPEGPSLPGTAAGTQAPSNVVALPGQPAQAAPAAGINPLTNQPYSTPGT